MTLLHAIAILVVAHTFLSLGMQEQTQESMFYHLTKGGKRGMSTRKTLPCQQKQIFRGSSTESLMQKWTKAASIQNYKETMLK